MSGDSKLLQKHQELIQNSLAIGAIGISAISFWEIAMLARQGRLALGLPIEDWIHAVQSIKGLQTLELNLPILLESVHLPGNPHKDPADRMIMATARIKQAKMLSYDSKILAYAEQGFLNAVN